MQATVEKTEKELPIEDVYYFITNERYKGGFPMFFTDKDFPEIKVLEDNYEVIKKEIFSVLGDSLESLTPGFIPHGSWDGTGWKSVSLYSFGFKKKKNCKQYPKITKIVEAMPGMTTAQISVISPRSKMKPHLDDTSAVGRVHLGIQIPGRLPEVGLRVDTFERDWEEGKAFALNAVKAHTAWNYTEEDRIILLVDVVHKQYLKKKLRICGNVLGQLVMKQLAVKYPVLKKLPKWLIMTIHKVFGFGAWLVLLTKNALNL